MFVLVWYQMLRVIMSKSSTRNMVIFFKSWSHPFFKDEINQFLFLIVPFQKIIIGNQYG